MLNRKRLSARALASLPFTLLLITFATAQEETDSEAPVQAESTAIKAAPSASAALEEIVVRAPGKRAQLIQDVPGSVSAFGADQLQDYRVRGFEDTLKLVPNAFVEERSNSSAVISIRGNGTSGNNTDTGLGLYVDGIYDFVQGTQNNLVMYDIEQIEVLRGPQGSLYGRNAIGGAIVIETARPTETFLARISAERGNYKSERIEGVLNVPILEDKLFMRAAGVFYNRDPYFFNTTLDVWEDGVEQVSGRLWLRYLPIEDLRIDAGVERTTESLPGTALTPYSAGDERITVANTIGYNNRGKTRIMGDILYEGLDWFDLQSITGYIRSRGSLLQDFDNQPGVNSESLQTLPAQQITQELRILSKPDGGPLNWLAGFNYFRDRADASQDNSLDIGLPEPIFQDVSIDGGIDTWAGFVQASYMFWDSLEVSASLRYSSERKFANIESRAILNESVFSPLEFEIDETDTYRKLNPGGSISYHFDDFLMAYFRATTAYKSGGFNFRPVPTPDDIAFAPEDAVNYELGVRATLWEGVLYLNPTIFRLYQDDLQIRREVVDGGTRYTFFANVGNGVTDGAELQVLLAPHPDIDVSFSYGFLDARFKDASTTQFGNVSNKRIPFVPAHTLNLSGEYKPLLPSLWNGAPDVYAFLRGDFYVTLGGYQNPQNTVPLDNRKLINLQAGIESEYVRLRMFVNNLTDQTYYVFVPPTEEDVGILNPPRTWGAAIDIIFG